MPAPTLYSESTYADYLASVLGSLADVLGWDAGSVQVQEAVFDALLDLQAAIPSIATIADVTTAFQIRGLRALGRRAIWRAVVQATAGKYDFSDSDANFKRSQMNSQAREFLKLAELDAMAWDPNYAVAIVSVKRTNDPYIVIPDTERVP